MTLKSLNRTIKRRKPYVFLMAMAMLAASALIDELFP